MACRLILQKLVPRAVVEGVLLGGGVSGEGDVSCYCHVVSLTAPITRHLPKACRKCSVRFRHTVTDGMGSDCLLGHFQGDPIKHVAVRHGDNFI